MTLLTIPVDLYSIKLYDWSKTDWFALEYLKTTKGYSGRNPFKRLIGGILRHTPVPVQILVLSPKFNAFIITTLLRQNAYAYDGLSRRDWMVFVFSFITTQLYWILAVSAGVFGIQWLADL
jgi:hypothetical protein